MPNNMNSHPNLHLRPEEELTESQIENPQTNRELYLDSLSAILRENVGYYVICEFLIGTVNIVRREGILYSSGYNFLTLYQEEQDRYVVCDIFSLKFITFYDTKTRPQSLRGQRRNSYSNANDGRDGYYPSGSDLMRFS